MVRFFILIISVIASISCYANPINASTAKIIAESFILEKHVQENDYGWNGNLKNMSLTLAYSYKDDEISHPMCYVFNMPDGRGFIVTAGDDCVNSVLGYTNSGSFNGEDIPEGLRWLLSNYAFQIKSSILQKAKKTEAVDSYSDIEPLLSSKWNQGYPFNNLCPIGSDGNRCPSGCIATAMAQILYYYRWPQHGNGYHSYVCNINGNADEATELYADFDNTIYQWDKMQDSYSSAQSDESNMAVATLMYHCGVSLDMQYKDGGSSPTSNKEPEALKKYFRYKADVKSLRHVSDEDFVKIVYNEVAHQRPVFVCGKAKDNSNGAHAFVCDGYKNGGYFHFNWGWSGKYDGYFLLTLMTPSENWDFSGDHYIVYNIVPYKGEIVTGTYKIELTEAGQLGNIIQSDESALYSESMKIKGDMNGSDILALRKLSGRDEYNQQTGGMLTTLDLSEANIVDGGTSYYITDDETYYQTQNGTKKDVFPDQAFMRTNLCKIVLPNSVKSIGKYAFAFCHHLTDVEFGTNTTKIGFSSFNYTSLDSLIIPEQIREMEAYAFCNISSLKKVRLCSNLHSIGYRAFEKDNNIGEIECMMEMPFAINDNVFSEECYSSTTLRVPRGKIELYRKENGWKNFRNIVDQGITAIEDNRSRNNICNRFVSIGGITGPSFMKGITIVKMNDGTNKKVISK